MNQPLVSIISFCKDQQSTIRRSIESVLNQTYRNLEFVVQDEASTDDTLQILQDYAKRDPRIKLVSDPESGPEQAFLKLLHRCNGEIMGTCLSDEELAPDAIAKAVATFESDAELGAITGDGYLTDENGSVIGVVTVGEFNFVDYLFAHYRPFWSGSFFRTKALADIGLSHPGWNLDCIEFEIWCRLASDHLVKHISYPFFKQTVHTGQLCSLQPNMRRDISARLGIIENMFSATGFFGVNDDQKNQCMINQLSIFADHARACGLVEEGAEFKIRLDAFPDKIRRSAETAAALPHTIHSKSISHAAVFFAVLSRYTSATIRKSISLKTKTRVHEAVRDNLLRLARFHYTARHQLGRLAHTLRGQAPEGARTINDAGTQNLLILKIYLETAAIYESRGQIRQALEMWKAAKPLNRAATDGVACQARLKLPSATEQDIMDGQRRWAARHAQSDVSKSGFRFKNLQDKRKIRIGYHCSFFNSDCIRTMLQGAIEERDSTKFSVYGYSRMDMDPDILNAYDAFRKTETLSDSSFVDLIRQDEVDVFVELSGFSEGHRFAAMASRCAPVQVSYLNHTGTSGVANVDYVLADDICTPPKDDVDRCFTEEIYRLPSCFFCFDYDKMPAPPVSPPPFFARGSVTFGSFASGGKINEELISLWAALLHRVPGSTFFIKNSQLNAVDNRRFMMDRFRRFGVGPERLRIESGADRQSILRSYADVDITLDTWPYCGGNTTGESFWQGVPVVTLSTPRFSARYGASLVTAAGCSDLVAKSTEEYIEIAARLAGDPERLRKLRSNLRTMYKQHGLGDSGRLARVLEEAYVVMLERYWSSRADTRQRVPAMAPA